MEQHLWFFTFTNLIRPANTYTVSLFPIISFFPLSSEFKAGFGKKVKEMLLESSGKLLKLMKLAYCI